MKSLYTMANEKGRIGNQKIRIGQMTVWTTFGLLFNYCLITRGQCANLIKDNRIMHLNQCCFCPGFN